MNEPTVASIDAHAILDSRGTPTLRATVRLSDGAAGIASAPSGKSTGKAEKRELRDGGAAFGGRGVERAVANVRGPIADALRGASGLDTDAADRRMVELDGSEDRSRLGANAIVAASMALRRAAAASLGVPLWRSMLQANPGTPVPLFNVINGGAHAEGGLAVQEIMLMPQRLATTSARVRCGAEIYAALRETFAAAGMGTSVGDEGGFVYTKPFVADALRLLCEAVEKAGYAPGEDVFIAIDAAANGFVTDAGAYAVEAGKAPMSAGDLCNWWCELVDRFPIALLEDPFAEEDDEGWKAVTRALGERITIVGDDNFVTDAARIARASREGIGNAALLKPNQIGTVAETIDAWRAARDGGFATVVSHRSGETCDSFIADLAVAIGSEFLKSGAPARAERVEKYNRLVEIESSARLYDA